jgi:hypothetical protein
MTFGSEGRGISSGSSAGGTTSNFFCLSAMLDMDQCPGLATRAFDTIVPCAPEIHRAKRGGQSVSTMAPFVATHYPPHYSTKP